jgi:hypothetical protein
VDGVGVSLGVFPPRLAERPEAGREKHLGRVRRPVLVTFALALDLIADGHDRIVRPAVDDR